MGYKNRTGIEALYGEVVTFYYELRKGFDIKEKDDVSYKIINHNRREALRFREGKTGMCVGERFLPNGVYKRVWGEDWNIVFPGLLEGLGFDPDLAKPTHVLAVVEGPRNNIIYVPLRGTVLLTGNYWSMEAHAAYHMEKRK